MNSMPEIEPASGPPVFSDHPGLHYILTICVMALVSFPFSWKAGHDCLSSGNDYWCTYDIDRLQALGGGGASAGIEMMQHALVVTLFLALGGALLLSIVCGPVFLVAAFISRLFRIQQNAAGAVFWITAWITAFLTLPFASLAHWIFDPGHVSWRADMSMAIGFGVCGAFCGVVYCLLAFRRRIAALIR